MSGFDGHLQIAVDAVSFRYGRRSPIFSEFHWSAAGPGLVVLLGPNGAGKTTLIRLMTASLRPSSGEIRIDDQSLSHDATRKQYLASLGYVPQESTFLPRLTVREFLSYAGWLKRVPGAETEAMAVQALTEVSLLDHLENKLQSMSGGEIRRAALAQAIMHNPSLLVLDEPSAGLDPRQRVEFRELVSARSKHSLVIMSTHQVDEVPGCDRVDILQEGRLAFSGTPQQLTGVEQPATADIEGAYLKIMSDK